MSTDQRLLAAPRGFSQRATSFIASWCQGIHRMPLSRSNTSRPAVKQSRNRSANRQTGPHAQEQSTRPRSRGIRQINPCNDAPAHTTFSPAVRENRRQKCRHAHNASERSMPGSSRRMEISHTNVSVRTTTRGTPRDAPNLIYLPMNTTQPRTEATCTHDRVPARGVPSRQAPPYS
jgi:hypothetical protein